nr:histidine kinase [uncultured Bacillus sp.]
MVKNWMRHLRDLPIQVKIYGMVLLIISIISSVSLIEVRTSLIETLSSQLDERVKAVGRDVAARSSNFMLTHNIYQLNELAKETVDHNPDIEYVIIQDEQGNVLVDTFIEKDVNKKLLAANHPSSEQEVNLIKFMSDKGIIRDVAVPIIEDFGGTVRVGLTEETLVSALDKVTKNMFITMFIVLIISIGIAFSLTKILTSPLKELLYLTEKVGKGNFSLRAQPVSNDEVGKLSFAFNTMLSDLQKTENDKRNYYDKINLRNRELLLLNKLSVNITSEEHMKEMLDNLLSSLIKELHFHSAGLRIYMSNNWESIVKVDSQCGEQCNLLENGSDCITKINNHIYHFPIKIKNHLLGELSICSSGNLDFQSKGILNSITTQLAILIENVDLWKELKQKEKIRKELLGKVIRAQEEERKRIARELHDETSQSLSAILLGLSMLSEYTTHEEKIQEIQSLRDMVHHTLQEVHEMSWQLRPSVLDKFGLIVALQRYISDYKDRYGLDVDLMIDGVKKLRLQTEFETTTYRIIQEALTNVSRYANAKNVSVIVDEIGNYLSVIVEDDGVGFDVNNVLNKEPDKKNLGLHGMLERASLIGGKLTIESEAGNGTTIYLKIPLTKEVEVS